MKSSYIAETHDLCKNYYNPKDKSTVYALQAVSFRLIRHSVTAIIGHNGSGKSTLLKMIAGIERPSRGSIEFHCSGEPVISYQPQYFSLYEDLTVGENISLYADLYGMKGAERRERIQKLLAISKLELFRDRQAKKLSGGMKRKLSLICTILRTPDIWLLDEPTIGIDLVAQNELFYMIYELASEEKISVIITTNDLDEAEKCDYANIMKAGEILVRQEDMTASLEDRCYEIKVPANYHPRVLQAAVSKIETIADVALDGNSVNITTYDPLRIDMLDVPYFGKMPIYPRKERLRDKYMQLWKNHRALIVPECEMDHARSVHQENPIVIKIDHLNKRFDDFWAVKDATFHVRQGEIFGILGFNGSGKTTLFRMMCGILSATGGKIMINGKIFSSRDNETKSQIGYVAQAFSLYDALTVKQNLAFFGGMYGLAGERLEKRIDDVEKLMGLQKYENLLADKLSGGNRRRLSIAVGLIHEPQILFLDEPTAEIDMVGKRQLWQLLTAIASKGITIVVSTHFMGEAEYCDRVILQNEGEIIAQGSPQELRNYHGGTYKNMKEVFIAVLQG